MQTMQQQRAAYALKAVQNAANDKTIHSEYKSYASNLPAMIHMNGLGQAVAFFKAKSASEKPPEKRNTKERAYFELYQMLSDWLCSKGNLINPMPQQPYHRHDNVLAGITTEDMHHYRLAQAEAQMLMDWVKKFAKAFMTNEDDNGGRD